MYERTAGIPGPKDGTYQPMAPPAPEGYPPPPQQAPPPVTGGVPVQQQFPSAPYRVTFVPDAPPPVAPPGYIYVLKNDITVCGIILAIVFFPLGLLCMLCLMEKSWQLSPIAWHH